MITAACTHTGNVRTMNQDAFVIFQKKTTGDLVAAVADGMGGHRAGNIASVLALESVRNYFDAHDDLPDERLSHEAIAAANECVFERANADADCFGMGTTICMVQTHEDRFTCAHVGDSRVYRYSETDGLRRVTRDHSLVQELVDTGRIDESEAAIHPQRNIITRAIGTAPDVQADVETDEWEKDEILLLCSDGLSSEVSDAQMEAILRKSGDIREAMDALIDSALSAGGLDNITAILVQNCDEVNE